MPADIFSPVAALLGVASFFAFANERFVEATFSPLLERAGLSEHTWTLRYIAIFTALGLVGYLFPIDLLSPVLAEFGISSPLPAAGAWVTALAVGLGSNGFHDLFFGSSD